MDCQIVDEDYFVFRSGRITSDFSPHLSQANPQSKYVVYIKSQFEIRHHTRFFLCLQQSEGVIISIISFTSATLPVNSNWTTVHLNVSTNLSYENAIGKREVKYLTDIITFLSNTRQLLLYPQELHE